MKNNKKNIVLGVIASFVFAATIGATVVSAQTTQIGGATLKLGSKGASVLAMQQFLATNPDIYPGGLKTGYFGSMSKAAAIQFQLAYNLTADGVVGPATKAKMNSVMSAGYGIDVYAPVFTSFSLSQSGRNATINLSSNESVKTTVFYDTNAINWVDGDAVLGAPVISGMTNVDNSFSTSKQITLNNLSANTRYNYVVLVTDASGNYSATMPVSFTTGQ